MKLVILGAAGRTGKHVVQQALAAGHSVVACMRKEEQLDVNNPKLQVHVGDARSIKDLTRALAGQEAVISVLGSNKPGDDLMVASTQALLKAMHQTHVKRVLMMSSFLASPNFKKRGISRVVGKLMQSLVKDKTSAEELLKQSDTTWTIIYATRLDGVPPGSYRVVGDTETVSVRNSIARADVAEYMLNQLDDPTSFQKSVVITSK